MAARQRPSYGFKLAGTSFGVKPGAGGAKGVLSQLFPELGIKTPKTDTEPEEIDKPEETQAVTKPATGVGVTANENVSSEPTQEESGLEGSFSSPVGFNFGQGSLGPSGPQGRGGSRLGYTGSVLEDKSVDSGKITLTENLPTPRGTAPEPEPTEQQVKADRLLSSFIGEKGTSESIGAKGVGRALEYGYTPEQIIGKAKTENLTFGEQAARGLGIQTTLSSYTGGDATEGALGLKAIERMRAKGLSNAAIQSLAQQQGLKFGQKAAQNLGVGSAQTYSVPAAAPAAASSSAPISSYVGSGGTSGSVGLAAIQRAAAAQGISQQEAARRAKAQGSNLGAAAKALLG